METTATPRLYNWRWRRLREQYLRINPLCRICWEGGRRIKATVVDHIIPHRGNMVMFWDEDNWQPLCKAHHDALKQREEKRGYSEQVGEDGWPVDPSHPANADDAIPRG